ncbi:UNVERIFIED_CONTAM: RING-H2 finger protein ATL34 [Sesamum latifolium]|uniref:RING-H2 finger protein ATL34 n=1 Tax=Sesamum latifolium TaxID=2727402 RepID=A0AAW2XJJ1_9LAMI
MLLHRCTVCLSEYHEEDTLRILPQCRHSFHATCIDVWLQQHSTCPVCRISLRELPERKWFMQPMFSSAVRSQYTMQSVNAHYCNCMANSERRSSGSHNNQETDPIQDGHCQPEGDRVNDLASVNHDGPTKDSAFRKSDSPSSQNGMSNDWCMKSKPISTSVQRSHTFIQLKDPKYSKK